jgi:hypothetical protein
MSESAVRVASLAQMRISPVNRPAENRLSVGWGAQQPGTVGRPLAGTGFLLNGNPVGSSARARGQPRSCWRGSRAAGDGLSVRSGKGLGVGAFAWAMMLFTTQKPSCHVNTTVRRRMSTLDQPA